MNRNMRHSQIIFLCSFLLVLVGTNKIIDKLLQKAKRIGADAIILEEKSTTSISMYGGITSFKVIAIRFTE